jgi:hypothetical protein
MKNLFPNFDDSEKQRILEMHRFATKNNYLSESIRMLYENPTETFAGEINDIKARIDAQASYNIVKQGDIRKINLTPTSVSLTTSEITLPNSDIIFQISKNEMFLKFSGFEFPLGKLDVFPQFSQIYKTFPLEIKDNNLLLPDRDKTQNVVMPEESMQFVNWLLSQPATLKLFKKVLNSLLNKERFQNVSIPLPNNPLTLKITNNTSLSTDIGITMENSQILDLTKDKMILVSNVDIDLKYNSNLPSDSDKMIEKITDDMASNIKLPKF